MQVPDIRNVTELQGKRVLMRASLNEPIINGRVQNDTKLKGALQTIRFLAEKGARVIVIGHLSGRTESTLLPVYEYLKQHIPLSFITSSTGTGVTEAVSKLENGSVLLLENIRQEEGEEKNDPVFAKELASHADIFVNDDFTVAHRTHAGVVGVTEYLRSFAGPQFIQEMEGLLSARTPESPSLCVIGGAKFETKAPLIRLFLKTYDTVFVGGALANDFFKAQGYATGRSLVSSAPPLIEDLLENEKLKLPSDVIVSKNGEALVKLPQDVAPEDYIYDAGPETEKILARLVARSAFVLWNGPLGQCDAGYTESTEHFARMLMDSNARSVVGGGDTVAAIAKLHPREQLSFVSTAGGAMLEFLLNGTLPGIDALLSNAKKFQNH